MSNSKKLTYEMREPAFLSRLRNAAAGAGHQERHIAPRNRRLPRGEDDEDAPAYVLSDGSEITRGEFLQLGGVGEDDKAGDGEGGEGTGEGGDKAGERKAVEGEAVDGEAVEAVEKETSPLPPPAATTVQVADIGGPRKKRKAARIVGADDDEEGVDTRPKGKPREGGVAVKKGKAKGKRRVKLSFGDDE